MTSTLACWWMASNRAASASGSWNGWPSAEITLTVFSGLRIAVGAGLVLAVYTFAVIYGVKQFALGSPWQQLVIMSSGLARPSFTT